MRFMIEDDGTIEIIEVKIVRVRNGDNLTLKSVNETRKNNITTEKFLNVVRLGSLAILGVAQLAIMFAGLGNHF